MKKRLAAIAFIATCFMLASAAVSAQSQAEKEFKRITDDMRARMNTMQAYQYIDYSEKQLQGFISRFPKTPEAGQAQLLLGRLYSSVGDNEKAADALKKYIDLPVEKDPSELAQAKFVLASSYVALERYDEAEKLLRDVSNSGVAVDPRIVQAASQELTRIGALRRVKVGAPAVPFSANSSDGKKISLDKYRGKVVLVDFWAAWCAPCRMEMPNVIKVYEEFHKKGFEIVGVSLDDERAKFQGFVTQNKMVWPQIFEGRGWGSGIAQSYAVNAIPATFLIDRKGILRYKNVRGERLRSAVKELVEEK